SLRGARAGRRPAAAPARHRAARAAPRRPGRPPARVCPSGWLRAAWLALACSVSARYHRVALRARPGAATGF
nr:hypothetical protein [Tanacetum cinerariifolium]